MLFKTLALGALALGCAAVSAIAADRPALCVALSGPKGAIAARDGKWTELTPQQWQFLRGVYVVNPQTPPGLPYGDKAALAEIAGNPGALVFFLDGDKACTPMPIPHQLVEMLRQIAAGEIPHEDPQL